MGESNVEEGERSVAIYCGGITFGSLDALVADLTIKFKDPKLQRL